MFLYIILHEIYMINIDPITFFLNFLYVKDADHSSPKLIFNTIFNTIVYCPILADYIIIVDLVR